MRPLCIDLFCGCFGWSAGWLELGGYVVGFDLEHLPHHGPVPKGADLVIQNVLTLHGRQFRDASLILASPPCQFFSYCAMPWSRAKQLAADVRADPVRLEKELTCFDACFRIQREAIEAAGHFIPLVVENVRGACPWVGRSRWNYGSFHLWGDVPALMPMTAKRSTAKGEIISVRHLGCTNFHQSEATRATKNDGGSWFNIGSPGQKETNRNPVHQLIEQQARAGNGLKQGGDWWHDPKSITRTTWSTSPARKAASAMIAKIPLPLSQHIARTWMPA